MSEQQEMEGIPPAPKKERPRDPIFDALTEAFGEVRTKDERGRRNNAVRQLREADATPEEIEIAVAYCRRNFSHFTEKAVCGWLSVALQDHAKSGLTRRSFMQILNPDGEAK